MSIYKDLAILFSKLGFLAFGGPMAHIALMEKEVVENRKWFSTEEYLEMISFTNFLPGPNSTELAILIGYKKGKIKGMVISGACFILPAVLIVIALTFIYMSFNTIPNVASLFSGFRPVVAAIVSLAAYKMALKHFKNTDAFDKIMFVVMFTLLLFAIVSEIQALLIGGITYLAFKHFNKKDTAFAIEPFSLSVLLVTMFKIGSVLYGSGYVLMSYLNTEFVENLGWINLTALSDLLTLGEISPGPVFTTATALGTYLGSIPGALVATTGIFLPSFLLIGILYPLFTKMKTWRWFKVVLGGLNLVSLSIIVVTAYNLSSPLIYSPVQVGLYLISLVILDKFKVSNLSMFVMAGVLGILFL